MTAALLIAKKAYSYNTQFWKLFTQLALVGFLSNCDVSSVFAHSSTGLRWEIEFSTLIGYSPVTTTNSLDIRYVGPYTLTLSLCQLKKQVSSAALGSNCITDNEAAHLNSNRGIWLGFEVLPPVVTKSSVFYNVTPCIPFKVTGRFGRTYRLIFMAED
jgi:hypothetical protein